MKVQELIEALEDYGPDAEVRMATQPSYPFENGIGDVVDSISFSEDNRGFAFRSQEPIDVVYITDSGQIDYLGEEGRISLGW